jgi:hypothetical protein
VRHAPDHVGINRCGSYIDAGGEKGPRRLERSTLLQGALGWAPSVGWNALLKGHSKIWTASRDVSATTTPRVRMDPGIRRPADCYAAVPVHDRAHDLGLSMTEPILWVV